MLHHPLDAQVWQQNFNFVFLRDSTCTQPSISPYAKQASPTCTR